MYFQSGAAIPELTFGTPHRVLDEGRTLPILFQMELDGGAGGAWVVKVADKRPSALLVELACSDLCAHFGIWTPEVAVARFPEDVFDYDDSEVGRAARAMHQRNRNELVFCSRHLGGATKITPENLRWPLKGQDEQMLFIFLFDALFWHSDRSVENPNALWHRRNIVAIDHGRAMFGIEQIDESGVGPDFTKTLTQHAWEDHVVFSTLANRWRAGKLGELFPRFAALVSTLDDATVAGFARRWPPGLDKGGMRGEIIRFVRARRLAYEALEDQVRYALQNA